MKHYSMGWEHGVQPNYHPSAHAVKSDYSLASQWVVPTSFLFSNHQMRMTAVLPHSPHFKNMRIWICCILGKGSGIERWDFHKSCFTHLMQCMLWQTGSHMDWNFLQQRTPAHIVQLHMDSVLGCLERTLQAPNAVLELFGILPPQNCLMRITIRQVSKLRKKKKKGRSCVCVCVLCLSFCLSTSSPTKKNRVIRRGHNY